MTHIEQSIAEALQAIVEQRQFIIDNDIPGWTFGDCENELGNKQFLISVEARQNFPNSPLWVATAELAAVTRDAKDKNSATCKRIYQELTSTLNDLTQEELSGYSGFQIDGIINITGGTWERLPEPDFQALACRCEIYLNHSITITTTTTTTTTTS
jgi:hypothetical protein